MTSYIFKYQVENHKSCGRFFWSLPCAEPELLRSVSFSKMSSAAPEAMGVHVV